MVSDIMNALRRHPCVHGLAPRHMSRLTTVARQVRFARNEIIFREGDECNAFYLIISGRVALEIVVQGSPLRIQTLSAGDELGWSSMVKGSRRFQARALVPANVLVFAGQDFRMACEEDPALGYALISRLGRIVSETLDATRLQLLDMYSSSGLGR